MSRRSGDAQAATLSDAVAELLFDGASVDMGDEAAGEILGPLADELPRRGGCYGLAAFCIGVGQGLALALHA